MEIYERIRLLRKEYLHLSQEKFGERLGVTRDVIKNIELNTLVKPEQKEPLIKLICKEFNINYSWLKYGTGEMESNFKESILNDLADEFNLDETDQQIVSNYMKLDPISKKAIKDYLKSLTLLWKDENGNI